MKKHINIDTLFRNLFKNFEICPPEKVWIEIKQKIFGLNGQTKEKPDSN